jgi:hypothetical protein
MNKLSGPFLSHGVEGFVDLGRLRVEQRLDRPRLAIQRDGQVAIGAISVS